MDKDKEREEKFKKGMLDAIDCLNLESIKKPSIKEQIISKLKRRSIYITNKLEGCVGYSRKEKQARFDEINNFIDILEEILRDVEF